MTRRFLKTLLNVIVTLELIGGSFALTSSGQKPTDSALIPKYEQAEKLFYEARLLANETAEMPKRKAVEKLMAASDLYHETSSLGDEAASLNEIGAVLSSLGELSKSFDHYKRAMLLFKSLEDKRNEAITLSNMGSVSTSGCIAIVIPSFSSNEAITNDSLASVL